MSPQDYIKLGENAVEDHPLVRTLRTSCAVVPDENDAPMEKFDRPNTHLPSDKPDVVRANQTYVFGPDRCAGDDDVPFTTVREQPWHRGLVTLAARGLTAKECFLNYGGEWANGRAVSGSGLKSYDSICLVMRQPWFKQRVIDLLARAGQDHVKAFLETQIKPSLDTLVSIRDSDKASAAVRRQAANDLLDRFLGKPSQPYQPRNNEGETPTTPEDEARALREEIEQLNKTV